MRLAEFIRSNLDPIVAEWETFARTLVPAGSMDITELRDHAKRMLVVIAGDLEKPQTKGEEASKAKGHSDADNKAPDNPAQAHGSERAESGFNVAEMVSEYRALRASVVRMWMKAQAGLQPDELEDLVRFNEAIDQALAESTGRFSEELDRTRETFLGILGHDLRTPLGAMVTSAHFILEAQDAEITRKMASVIVSSGNRMVGMVDDLLDFTRGRLGAAMPLDRTPLDLKQVVLASVEELSASRPDTAVHMSTRGDLAGRWDGPRLSQVWSNLLDNALDHGSAGTPITVTAEGRADEVVLSFHNRGPAIPRSELRQIFNPMTSGAPLGDDHHLGLGLYIAEQIVKGHGGQIRVESTEEAGTTFTVRLPRTA